MSGMKVFGRRGLEPAQVLPPPASVGSEGKRKESPPLLQPSSFGAVDLRAEAQKARANLISQLREAIFTSGDIQALMKMENRQARVELADFSRQVIKGLPNSLDMAEVEGVVLETVNDILGLGPLESLLERDDIADIMVCGPNKIFIEVGGRLRLTDIRFRDEEQLRNVAQRIVSTVGRRVDESSPICDARLPDGSRVAIVIPPIAIDGTCITIRKFKKDKLRLEDLVQKFNSITKQGAKVIEIASTARCNILVSGGTGSGKTTLLNCVTRYIDTEESIITCEDAAELQLQQPNVRRWESRPPNLEGKGEVPMAQLVKASLRHRPERIIIGEVRGPEAFDLLQAMNTGHDGSAGTIHANNPREAISRMESLIAMGGFNIPSRQIREMIVSSIDIIIQASRLRDGSRKITHITEVIGMEGDTPILQDLMILVNEGEDAKGNLITRHEMTGVRPKFWEKAKYAGLEEELMRAMENKEV